MVSHNANLVVYADSEQIIVVDRHGQIGKIAVIKHLMISLERLKIADEVQQRIFGVNIGISK